MIFNRRKWSVTLMFVLCLGLLTPQANADSESFKFTDVPKDKPYASAVYQLAERNIISGYKDGTFKPGASITRGQAAAIITKLINLDTKNVKDQGFKDVSPNLWSYQAISAVAEKGIFRGYGDGRFGPNDKITRAQMASILIKTFEFNYYTHNYQATPFKDIELLMSHKDSVLTLYKLGIISGTSPTTFSPNDPITRAQAAVLISKTEIVRSGTLTVKANDYGWSEFGGYNDYHLHSTEPEKDEDEIIQVIPNNNTDKILQMQIVPVKVGTQKLTLYSKKIDWNSYEDFKKYYVHVSKEKGQFKIKFEETDDVLTTNVRLNVTKNTIKNISLATMDGAVIDEVTKFHQCNEYNDYKVYCLPLTHPGEYIATIEYGNGAKVRNGLKVEPIPSEFYYYTYSIEEIPTVTVDLREAKGDFSEFKETEKGIVKITREENSDIFHIQGLKEGNTVVNFPKSEQKRGVVDGLQIRVQIIGSIINVHVIKLKYENRMH
ncbi:S-layer homology domain-containing protein [Pseudoneobacillus sp. C159]